MKDGKQADLGDTFVRDTIEQVNSLRWIHPGSESLLSFFESYRLIDSRSYPTNAPRPKNFRGVRKPRRCAICRRGSGEVLFGNDAHLLPACVGNRHLFTYDECNECNAFFGRETEGHLATMLSAERALFGVQARKGAETKIHKPVNGGGRIGGQKRGEATRICTVEGDSSLVLSELGSNELKIATRTGPFSPMAAMRALGRVAWHLLPDSAREQNPEFLGWIREGRSFPVIHLCDTFLPGAGLVNTTFAVWEKVSGDGGWPELVLMLAIANTMVTVPLSRKSSEVWQPFPLPPCPVIAGGKPSTRVRTIAGGAVESWPISYNVSFDRAVLHSSADQVSVRAELHRSTGHPTVLEAEMLIEGPTKEASATVYSLFGGQLCGTIRFRFEVEPSDGGSFMQDFRILGIAFEPPEAVSSCALELRQATFDFMSAMMHGGKLRVVPDGSMFSVFGDLLFEGPDEPDLAALRQTLGL